MFTRNELLKRIFESKKERRCLKCKGVFLSKSRINRVCQRCKNSNNRISFRPLGDGYEY